jgi:hypothetical protein
MSTTAAVKDPPSEGPSAKRKAEHHVVRIVVVRDANLTEARRRRLSNESHDQGHGLSNEELSIGEAVLKQMPAPHSSEEGPADPSKSMFDVLKSTDIVAIGKEAASVREVDEQETAGGGRTRRKRLQLHNDRHKDTVLRVWTNSDTVEYQCDEKFEIIEVAQVNWKIDGAPPNLFEEARGAMPYVATKEHSTTGAAGNPESVWKWTSGKVPVTANNQQYKMTFKIGDDPVDPDVVCGDPPPN